MSKIIIKDGEDVEQALKRFKSKVFKDGTLAETRKRKYYSKPGVAKRERIKANKRKKNKF